jgi:hypothetical protein
MLHSYQFLKCWNDKFDHFGCVDISEFSAPLSDMLHYHDVITLYLYHLAGILMGEYVSPIQTKSYYELLHRTKFPMSLPVHINFSSKSNLTVVPSVVWYPTTRLLPTE